MPGQARKSPGGLIYHVLNRAAGKGNLFRDERGLCRVHPRRGRDAVTDISTLVRQVEGKLRLRGK